MNVMTAYVTLVHTTKTKIQFIVIATSHDLSGVGAECLRVVRKAVEIYPYLPASRITLVTRFVCGALMSCIRVCSTLMNSALYSKFTAAVIASAC